MQHCPDCRQWLDRNNDECSCGWRSINASNSDHRCVYQHSGKRCPYPGTISSSTHASTTWYCLGHYQNLNNTKRSVEILMEAEKNFIVLMQERIHWTVKLIPELYEKAKKEIQELWVKLFKK